MLKMKYIQKMIAMSLSLCVLANSFTLQTLASNVKEDSGGELLEELYYANQEELLDEGEEVSEESLVAQGELNEVYSVIEEEIAVSEESTDEQTVYEDYYAGAYIDENDNLIVCVTDSFESNTENDETILNELENAEDLESVEALEDLEEFESIDSENIELKEVEYSFNELTDTQSYVMNKYEEFYNLYTDEDTLEYDFLKSFVGIGVDEEYNCLVVDIIGLTDKKVDTFNALFGEYSYVDFKNVEEKQEDCTAYKPGRPIFVITSKSSNGTIYFSGVSIGYRARRTTLSGTENGFVTCGHGINQSIDGKVYKGTGFKVVVGTIIDWRNKGSVDASFVKIASGDSVSTTVKYSNNSGGTSNCDSMTSGYKTNLAKGTIVYKVGNATFRMSAKITEANYAAIYSGVTFTKLVRIGAASASGDSGGIVYVKSSSNNYPTGIIKGTDGIYTNYVKVEEVISAMNVYPY